MAKTKNNRKIPKCVYVEIKTQFWAIAVKTSTLLYTLDSSFGARSAHKGDV